MAAEAPEAAQLAAVLAPFLNEDGSIKLAELGEVQEAILDGEPVTDAQRAGYEAVRVHPGLGGRCLMAARRAHNKRVEEQVRENRARLRETGGAMLTETFRGGRLVNRDVEIFRPTRQRSKPTQVAPRTRARSRGAGRPAVRGASRRASARSGDSGDDGPSSESLRETPAEQVARRFRELDEFVARYGADYWYRDRPQDQLELGKAA